MAQLRKYLGDWLVWLATIIDPSPYHVIALPIDKLYLRAQMVINWAESTAADGTSAAYKRWTMVASTLQREFPDVPLHRINLVIEAIIDKQ